MRKRKIQINGGELSVPVEHIWTDDECRAYLAEVEASGAKRNSSGWLCIPNPLLVYGLLASQYDIDSNGALFKTTTGRLVSVNQGADAYWNVGLSLAGLKAVCANFRLHRAVFMLANRATIPEGWEINHKDKNPSNNRPSNLELIASDEHVRADQLCAKKKANRTGIACISWCKTRKRFEAMTNIGVDKQVRIGISPCLTLAYQLLCAHHIKHDFPVPPFEPTQYALERSRPAKTTSKAYKKVQQLIADGVITPMPLTVEVA